MGFSSFSDKFCVFLGDFCEKYLVFICYLEESPMEVTVWVYRGKKKRRSGPTHICTLGLRVSYLTFSLVQGYG